MIIKSKLKDYRVNIEQDFAFIEKLAKEENAQFVIDKNVFQIYKDKFICIPADKIYIVEATEENKVIDTALNICEKMTEIPAKRNVVMISLGGGIIQDITGFVANILYRGIKWVFVPTTLLAACDSCIGGKTSLNYKKYKNLLGTFYPPDEIYICSSFFSTLSEKDYYSGLGEVIKFNLMDGTDGYDNISENIKLLLEREDRVVSRFVASSLEFKKDFIERDEFDKGERIKLNFAHTFGHAIEVISKYNIPHGTAVAIGMIIANYISVQRQLLDIGFAEKVERILLSIIKVDVTNIKKPITDIVDAMRKDKKQINKELTAVLMTDIPRELCIIHDIKEWEVEKAFGHFYSLYEEISGGE